MTLIAIVVLLVGAACANAMTRVLPIAHATERQNHRTVTLRRGEELEVVLHSTYWQFKPLSASSVLTTVHRAKVHPVGSCVAGGGCGTVTVLYRAHASGIAFVIADRSSCGEASGCTSSTGRYELRVVIRS